MHYKPTLSSFLASLAYDLSPVILAGVVSFFMWENINIFMLTASILMGILSLYCLLQTIIAHRQMIYVDEQMIAISGYFGLNRYIHWSQVRGAVLKERENLMSRTDHLLVLHGSNSQVLYLNTSTLSEKDEEELLAFVRRKITLIVERSKPTI
jgi:hypothetical protein